MHNQFNLDGCGSKEPVLRDGFLEMTMITMGRETVRNNSFKTAPGLMGRMKSFLARSRAERQLHQLDDRLLADIGIVRGEISTRVWGN